MHPAVVGACSERSESSQLGWDARLRWDCQEQATGDLLACIFIVGGSKDARGGGKDARGGGKGARGGGKGARGGGKGAGGDGKIVGGGVAQDPNKRKRSVE